MIGARKAASSIVWAGLGLSTTNAPPGLRAHRSSQPSSLPNRALRSLQRNARLVLGGTDRQARLHAVHVGRRGELAGQEFLEALQVLADDLEDEADLAVEHVALAPFGQRLHV